MNLLLGIGNDLLADDGIGCYVTDRFSHPEWTVYNCGTVPENFTRRIREISPGMLVLVDAAQMGLTPGTIRMVPLDRVADAGIGTHQLPLDSLCGMVSSHCGSIYIIGIQPGLVDIGEMMTPDVITAGDTVIRMLADSSFLTLPWYE